MNDGKSASLIDAAHVVPFRVSKNDDPRNGIALCRNHHAGFDHGWFTVREDYRIEISKRLKQTIEYVRSGAPVYLPENPKYAPAQEALAWHRNHVLSR